MSENTEFLLEDLEGIEGLEEFDAAEHLDTPEAIAAFLSSAFALGDIEHFKQAMKTAARAEGMAKIAASAGVTREGAYKALRKGSKPQINTIVGLLDALGMAFQIVPKSALAHDNSYALAA